MSTLRDQLDDSNNLSCCGQSFTEAGAFRKHRRTWHEDFIVHSCAGAPCGRTDRCGNPSWSPGAVTLRNLIDLPGVGVVGDSMPLKDILWDVVKLWDIGAFAVESAFRESAEIAMERLKRAHLEMR